MSAIATAATTSIDLETWKRDGGPRPEKRPDGWPTRAAMEWLSPAELAIRNAMLAVEETPGGSRALTDAVNLLSMARDRFADHVEGKATQMPGSIETFDGFSAENRTRCESPNGFNHPLSGWSLSDWMVAVMGELGEAANVLKKLNRVRDGIPGNAETPEQLRAMLADELADADIYLDLVYQAAGIHRPSAIRAKFDRTSAKIGYGG